jgi:hypothetical protein
MCSLALSLYQCDHFKCTCKNWANSNSLGQPYAISVDRHACANATRLGPKILVDMGMRVTGAGGLNKTLELYVAANLSQYLYDWDPIEKRSFNGFLDGLNRFGCGPDTPPSEGRACLETYRVELPAEMGVNETVDLDLHGPGHPGGC